MAAVYDDVLQGKLDQLWFRLPAHTVAGSKAERQAMLLREFQIAARGSHGARDPTGGVTIDTARLVQADLATFPNAVLPAATVPTGLADAATLKAIEAWLAPTANLRAPVVFEARKHGPAATPWKEIAQQGFLFHDEDVPTQPRVFVSDFTGRYPLNGGRPPQIAVGDSTRWFDRVRDVTTKGIECTARQSRYAPFSPKAVTGDDWDQLSDAKKSNFRVVASIACVEADGVFDGINAYDNAVLSAGPYHYTAFPNRDLGPAELGAFLSYFAFQHAAESADLFSNLGFGPTDKWSKSLFVSAQRVYRGTIGYAIAGGGFQPPATVTQRDWVRMWPALHRLQFAFRTNANLKLGFWPFARQRIIDLLKTPWAAKAGPPGAKTLGDAFRSEASVALLLRWHVYSPGSVVARGVTGTVPAGVVATAGLGTRNVSTWTGDDEAALVKAFADAQKTGGLLRAISSKDIRKTLDAVTHWTRPELSDGVTGPTLARTRNFVSFTDGVPFPGGSR